MGVRPQACIMLSRRLVGQPGQIWALDYLHFYAIQARTFLKAQTRQEKHQVGKAGHDCD
jgi:hypothetical protein